MDLWNKEAFDVTVLDKFDQSISCEITSTKENFYRNQTFVYGANKGLERKSLWMTFLSMKLRAIFKPWLLCGDFNVVKSLAEKWGSTKLNSYEVEFGECLQDLEVFDLTFSGCFFTWTNKSEGDRFVARKLDRVLVNYDWLCNFGQTSVDFPTSGLLDRSPALISIGTLRSFGPKPFKFYNFWMEHKDFMDWIREGWSKQVSGVPVYKLCVKLRAIKAVLKRQNIESFEDLKMRIL